jgi:aryl-alcohol dehydrogenase-like predicted oxidoreductase
MERRRLGRTQHMSTVAIFGSFAVSNSTQAEADVIMEEVIRAGVNHIDISPLYGLAEQRVGPWMPRERSRFFLGCKTRERTRQAAADQLRRSLEVLQTDRFDLYQFHEVVSIEELDKITAPGGALEAVVAAREEGLTRFIGLCGHGLQMPAVILEALRRFDFDTVLFPLNPVLMGIPGYRRDAEEALRQCRARDVGVMIIKSIAREPWGAHAKTYNTWYRPFDDSEHIQNGVNFALSHDVTGICTAGEPSLQQRIFDACERFTPLSDAERETLIAEARRYSPIYDENGPIWPR